MLKGLVLGILACSRISGASLCEARMLVNIRIGIYVVEYLVSQQRNPAQVGRRAISYKLLAQGPDEAVQHSFDLVDLNLELAAGVRRKVLDKISRPV